MASKNKFPRERQERWSQQLTALKDDYGVYTASGRQDEELDEIQGEPMEMAD